MRIARYVLACHVLLCPSLAVAVELTHVFVSPSDDRWHYPFNFTPGARATASCFGATGESGFNDRDGVLIVGWDTSENIENDRPPLCYNVRSVVVTLTNEGSAAIKPEWPVDLTVDEWFTFGSGHDLDPGRPIELFGVGFGPEHERSTWNEASIYVGSANAGDLPRDPYPFVFHDETFEVVHVEDSVRGLHNEGLSEPFCDAPSGVCPFTPTPWAIGEPFNYSPGSQTVPFDVHFEVDLSLSEGRVRRYFQEHLSEGRVLAIVTSLQEVEPLGPAFSFPSFFTKEGVALDALAKAPSLKVVIETGPSFDANSDGVVSLGDWPAHQVCLNGPLQVPAPFSLLSAEECLCVFDLDGDGDVDLADVASFAPTVGKE